MQAAADADAPFVTCEAVITEACHIVRRIDGAADSVLANVASGLFQIPFRLSARAEEVRALRRKYRDVPMDLADACLVDLATVLATPRILTVDADFRVYRWGRNKPFELLIDLV